MPETSYSEEVGFLGQVLEEFGVPWTSIAIFVSLIFSGFGLDKYFSVAAWIVTTAVSFTIVFLFKRQVSGNFALVALISGVIIAMLLGGAALLAGGITSGTFSVSHLNSFLSEHKTLSTVYVGLVIMLPLATMMLSYRRQETIFGGRFPKSLRDAIRSNLVDLPFYKENQRFELEIKEIKDDVVRIMEVLEFTIINRTRSRQEYTFGLTPGGKGHNITSVLINNDQLDVTDPEFRSLLGIRVPYKFGPGSHVYVKLAAEVDYQRTDSEVVTSYIPTTSFELVITNPFPNDAHVAVESLLRDKATRTPNGDKFVYRSQGATLPHQGFKVSWTP